MPDAQRFVTQLRALFDGERDPIANAANLAAFLGDALADLNWAGFYFVRGDEFPGHIACDAASAAEIVVPFERDGTVIGVLDVDSPRLARFGAAERTALEAVAAFYVEASDGF